MAFFNNKATKRMLSYQLPLVEDTPNFIGDHSRSAGCDPVFDILYDCIFQLFDRFCLHVLLPNELADLVSEFVPVIKDVMLVDIAQLV